MAAMSLPRGPGLHLQTVRLAARSGGRVVGARPSGRRAPCAVTAVFRRANPGAGGRGRGLSGRGRLAAARSAAHCGLRPRASLRAMERLTLPPGGAAAVDDYLEYRR